MPSLELNLADAYRRAGKTVEARVHLSAAAADLDALPDNEYGSMIRAGVDKVREALDSGSRQPLV